jgi:hypothetical protein
MYVHHSVHIFCLIKFSQPTCVCLRNATCSMLHGVLNVVPKGFCGSGGGLPYLF